MSELTPVTIPALALRGLTVFPGMSIHFDVGREPSMKALEKAMTTAQPIFLATQRDLTVEQPKEEDLYEYGTIPAVRQILRRP